MCNLIVAFTPCEYRRSAETKGGSGISFLWAKGYVGDIYHETKGQKHVNLGDTSIFTNLRKMIANVLQGGTLRGIVS